MSEFAQRHGRLAALVAAASLTACGAQSGALVPAQGTALVARVSPDAKPPACKGQSTTSDYAMSTTVSFKAKRGTLCIPAFGGLGGSIAYPAAKPSVTTQLTSSTTNYNGSLPTLGKGKAVFYLQMTTSDATTFGKTLGTGGGLTGKPLQAKKTYTAYGEAKLGGVAGITIPFTPCNAVATSGKYGGVITKLGTLLKGQKITSAATIFIEIYPGAQAKAKC